VTSHAASLPFDGYGRPSGSRTSSQGPEEGTNPSPSDPVSRPSCLVANLSVRSSGDTVSSGRSLRSPCPVCFTLPEPKLGTPSASGTQSDTYLALAGSPKGSCVARVGPGRHLPRPRLPKIASATSCAPVAPVARCSVGSRHSPLAGHGFPQRLEDCPWSPRVVTHLRISDQDPHLGGSGCPVLRDERRSATSALLALGAVASLDPHRPSPVARFALGGSGNRPPDRSPVSLSLSCASLPPRGSFGAGGVV